ncbi:hypothetical protein [Bartonella rochalimae]|uniref:Uncharacterized protein n=1 Tax=Bartonella rochalimae ATCC BAA-1498 TaxID=685782 RepID=E6YK92_9HYPH|nr:hypothetical protein [Bartonella rochalimae]KEC57485.1 hypothetical protein O99_00133 [Bartonella rochalimae ATCC BAA-1498]CBI77280.1 conserved membrane hypothetical protein [Bartonella rochalimae ATCC BAA-1498]
MFGIITFIFLCFSGITKNLEFIQGVLIFVSVGLIIVTTIFAILCNSNIPSELQNNPKYKDDGTTGWVKLTCDLQQYMHRLLNIIILALIALIFPNSYKDTVSLPVISRYVEHKFPFSLDTVLWYSDIALWYLNIVLWYYFLCRVLFLMLYTRSLINISILTLQSSIIKQQ